MRAMPETDGVIELDGNDVPVYVHDLPDCDAEIVGMVVVIPHGETGCSISVIARRGLPDPQHFAFMSWCSGRLTRLLGGGHDDDEWQQRSDGGVQMYARNAPELAAMEADLARSDR